MKLYLLGLMLLGSLLSLSSQAMDSRDPADWLARMVEARKTQTYSGTFVYSHGGEMSTMQVVHRFNRGMEQERLVALDGEPREIIRQGEKVICIFPGKEQVELEQALPVGPFASGLAGAVAPMASVYSVKMAGMERLAGHEVVKVAVMAKDVYRYSYLLWLEEESGLLVKSMLTDRHGEVLEQFQFTTLDLQPEVSDETFAYDQDKHPVLKSSENTGVGEQPPLSHDWEMDWMPEGFSPARFVTKTNNIMPETSRSRIYTDGLTTFSIFVEPRKDAVMPEGASRMGATSAYSRYLAVGDERYVVTVVGEVPIETVKKVADNMRMITRNLPATENENPS